MDDHQRRVWARMLQRLDSYEDGRIALDQLLADLGGLLSAADLNDATLQGFQERTLPLQLEAHAVAEGFATLDQEQVVHELATLRQWVEHVIAASDDQPL